MSFLPSDKRGSLSLFPSDVSLLDALTVQLSAKGQRVSRNFLIRAMAHVISETEMVERAIRKHEADRSKPAGEGEHTATRPIVYLLMDDAEKILRVEDRLKLKGVRYGATEILRALWCHPPELDRLAKELAKFSVQFPDKRTQAGRAKRAMKSKRLIGRNH